MSKENPTIYAMSLHETIHLNNGYTVMRVPGGWLYSHKDPHDNVVETFVPFSNEFSPKRKPLSDADIERNVMEIWDALQQSNFENDDQREVAYAQATDIEKRLRTSHN